MRIFFFAFDIKSVRKLMANLCHVPKDKDQKYTTELHKTKVPLRHKVEIILLALLPVFLNLGRLCGIGVSHFCLTLRK